MAITKIAAEGTRDLTQHMRSVCWVNNTVHRKRIDTEQKSGHLAQ